MSFKIRISVRYLQEARIGIKEKLYFHEYDTLPVCTFLKLNIRNQLLVLALF